MQATSQSVNQPDLQGKRIAFSSYLAALLLGSLLGTLPLLTQQVSQVVAFLRVSAILAHDEQLELGRLLLLAFTLFGTLLCCHLGLILRLYASATRHSWSIQARAELARVCRTTTYLLLPRRLGAWRVGVRASSRACARGIARTPTHSRSAAASASSPPCSCPPR